MNSRTGSLGLPIWISVAVYSICASKICSCLDYSGARIVTYGEPCVATRRLPFRIEGPKPPAREEKIPISLNFKVVSDMYVQPRRIEYPISIEMPCTSPTPSEKQIMEDTLRGKVYGYNAYVPPSVVNPLPSLRSYNFAIDVPVAPKDSVVVSDCETKQVQHLKGLKSRIDRILVPACEVSSPSSSSSSCQCN